jgi:hypothetical protein
MKLHLSKFIQTETGRKLMSIILGLGVACLFRQVCKGKDCTIYKAAPLEDFKDKIYKEDENCVKYVPTATKCSLDAKIVQFS